MTESDKKPIILGNLPELMTRQSLGEHLLFLRDGWIRTSGCREYSRRDGRAQWYVGIAADLYVAKEDKILTVTIQEDVNKFLNYYQKLINYDEDGNVINMSGSISSTKDLITKILDKIGMNRQLSAKDKFTNKLLGFRYDWMEKIPNRIVHSSDGMYKIRSLWLIGIYGSLKYGIDMNLLETPIQGEVQDTIKWLKEEYHLEKSREYRYVSGLGNIVINTQDDIDRGNLILDKVIAGLGFEVPKV